MRFPIPKQGDTRTVKRFAYLPTIVDDYKIWLETYYELQEYSSFGYTGGIIVKKCLAK